MSLDAAETCVADCFCCSRSETAGPAQDLGWKDTVLTWPGETVTLAIRFEQYAGLYVLHCHNLEHEDAGMTLNLEVF